MPSHTLTLVDATARGVGLDALTEDRPKAAVPFAGKFRVIDFTLTNCLHSGLRRILVLTQYKSHSLQKHLRDGWSVFNPELGEFIAPIPPQMRSGQAWYARGVDAVAQNRFLLERSRADLVLLLAGDLIYRMDYAELSRAHRETGAEVTLAARFATVAAGLTELELDDDGRVQGLAEVTAARAEAEGTRALPTTMGVCVIDKALLLDALEQRPTEADADGSRDPWRDFIAPLTASRRVLAYRFGETRGRVTPDRYWCDLAGIDPYYAANMALLETQPPLDLYQEDWTIRTHQGQYPPARTVPGRSGTEGIFVNSMLAAGTVITGGGVSHSVLFPRVRVRDGAIVDAAILFDGVQVGEGAELRNCIVEKDVSIPAHTRIGYDLRADRERFTGLFRLVWVGRQPVGVATVRKPVVVAPQASRARSGASAAQCGQRGDEWGQAGGNSWHIAPEQTETLESCPRLAPTVARDIPALSTRSPLAVTIEPGFHRSGRPTPGSQGNQSGLTPCPHQTKESPFYRLPQGGGGRPQGLCLLRGCEETSQPAPAWGRE